MRLSADKIKAAILDPDSTVRTAAVYYFSGANSPDPSLMPLVIQAFEKYGDLAFDLVSFLDGLAQTDESIAWICRQIDRIDPKADDTLDELFTEMVGVLRNADGALLERHAAEIREVRSLDEDSKAFISNRIQLGSLDPQALWQRLIEFCESQDRAAEDEGAEEEEAATDDYEVGWSIVDAVAKFPDQCAGEVLNILEREKDGDWLQTMAVRLAGVLRLEAATPPLVALLAHPNSWAGDIARWSLSRIGTDAVVKELSARYVADEEARLEIALLLANIHSDLSVPTCLELLGQEQDDEMRGTLIEALLMSFASEGIEPARQHILTQEKTPELLDVRDALLTTCQMLGVRFPELDAWREDSQHDEEFLHAWYQAHGYGDFFDDFESDELDDDAWETDADDADLEGDLADPSEDTIVRQDQKIGRNEPCPCGSGKKYKKCCLHKQVLG